MRLLASLAKRLRHAPIFSVTILVILVITAIVGPLLAPHDPTMPSLAYRLKPPFWQQGGSISHMLGTDSVGRDVLSRIIYGARVSLSCAILALLAGAAIGATIGLISGYFGGPVDSVLMRAADIALAFPIILFALLFAVIRGPSFTNVVVAIGLALWARYARVIRAEVLSLKQRDFIAQSRIAGCSTFRIIVRHLLPNVANTLTVLITLQIGWVIILEASLSFLGAGIPPPAPAWGSMVADGRGYLTSAWWISLFPGIAILLTVLCFNLLGDWLRDTLDPKLRQV